MHGLIWTPSGSIRSWQHEQAKQSKAKRTARGEAAVDVTQHGGLAQRQRATRCSSNPCRVAKRTDKSQNLDTRKTSFLPLHQPHLSLKSPQGQPKAHSCSSPPCSSFGHPFSCPFVCFSALSPFHSRNIRWTNRIAAPAILSHLKDKRCSLQSPQSARPCMSVSTAGTHTSLGNFPLVSHRRLQPTPCIPSFPPSPSSPFAALVASVGWLTVLIMYLTIARTHS